MPSDSMNIQEQGFRSRMFGGFDKNDVLAYMNTLANEAQQHELEYQEKLRQLQAQLDDLRSQRSDAEARVEALKAELAAANQRADLAESKRHESDEQLQKAQSVAESVQSEHREIQKNANIWQLKCHDLQQQNETLTQQLAAARQLNAENSGRCQAVCRERRKGAEAAGRHPEIPHGRKCPGHCLRRNAGARPPGTGGSAFERCHFGPR